MTEVKTQPPPGANSNNSVKRFTETTINTVLAKIDDFKSNGNLQLPANYSTENALRSAWLIIQQTKDLNNKPALEVCTTESIGNALFDMVLQGLSPVKKQCYFIVKGNKLCLERSYFGTIAVSKRVAGVVDAVGVPVYEKDIFKYEIDLKTGIKKVTEHQQDFDNIDIEKLKGAYAIVTYEDGHIEYDIMTMKQIRQSWAQGPAKGNSPAHRNFPDQMACRTVINRALKIPINSSNDDDLFDEPTTSTYSQQVEADVENKIQTNSNGADGKEPIGFDDAANTNIEDTTYTEDLSEDQQPENIKENPGNENIDAPPPPADLFTQPASTEKVETTQKTNRKKHF